MTNAEREELVRFRRENRGPVRKGDRAELGEVSGFLKANQPAGVDQESIEAFESYPVSLLRALLYFCTSPP